MDPSPRHQQHLPFVKVELIAIVNQIPEKNRFIAVLVPPFLVLPKVFSFFFLFFSFFFFLFFLFFPIFSFFFLHFSYFFHFFFSSFFLLFSFSFSFSFSFRSLLFCQSASLPRLVSRLGRSFRTISRRVFLGFFGPHVAKLDRRRKDITGRSFDLKDIFLSP